MYILLISWRIISIPLENGHQVRVVAHARASIWRFTECLQQRGANPYVAVHVGQHGAFRQKLRDRALRNGLLRGQ